jgi:uncharacterized membrane protein required for colicin V production
MGLDVALAIVILIAAIRGWIKGFVSQSVRIAGLIGCVYAADPLRAQVLPQVRPYVQSMPADIVDRFLWWACAAAAYVVFVGTATLLTKMTQRPEIPGIPDDSGRNDQFGGFLLGAIKGTLMAAFLAAGIQHKLVLDQLKTVSWADQQIKTSMALKWNTEYQPVPKIWSSVPVQHFTNQIYVMGIKPPGPDKPAAGMDSAAQQPPVQTASRSGAARDGQYRDAISVPAPPSPEPPAASANLVPGPKPVADPAIEEVRASLKDDVKPPN